MRKMQLRDYLLSLLLAALPLGVAACDATDDEAFDAGIDRGFICVPDMPGLRQSTFDVPAADGGSAAECLAECASHGVKGPEVTCEYHSYAVGDAGQITKVVCDEIVPRGCGRRPDGLCAPEATAALDEVGAYWARAAHLEAASVEAFERLAEELASHGAPPALVARARSAADDERRHAEATAALATRAGARVPKVEVAAFRVRPLLEIALENAREGQVVETFGALMALHQARRAPTPEVARVMTPIAEDELAHAELSWSVGRWLETRLGEEERAIVASARRVAGEALFCDQASSSAGLDAALGLPDRATRERLVSKLAAELWS